MVKQYTMLYLQKNRNLLLLLQIKRGKHLQRIKLLIQIQNVIWKMVFIMNLLYEIIKQLSALSVLTQLFYFSGVSDLPLDDGLPSTVTVLDAPDGGKVYLVGTAHFSIQSQEDVSRVRMSLIKYDIYFKTIIN